MRVKAWRVVGAHQSRDILMERSTADEMQGEGVEILGTPA
jgi:hypothetical protein